MIPYEDLVVALNNWRAKQGLPVATGVAPIVAPGSGPTSAPVAASAPAPAAYAADDSLEVGDELVEEHDASGYSGGYGEIETAGDDATSIGRPPQRGDYEEHATELASDSGRLRNQREDW
ncbi:MAG: hypothetical protein SFX73_16630 [Kofleriaceae bacterium]|nr:hypothetical protein [Kofleriaceae bacterium]